MNLKLNTKKIELEPFPRLLGFHLDPKLSFKHHLDITQQKIQKRLQILRILKSKRWSSNKKLLIHYYTTCIRPLSEFAFCAISSISDSLLVDIQKTENKIIRQCINSHFKDSNQKIWLTAGIEPIKTQLLKLHFNYLKKQIYYNQNAVLLRHIAESELLQRPVEHLLKKQRKNCLSEFHKEFPNLINSLRTFL